MSIKQRLSGLEQRTPVKPTRYFTHYVGSGRFYEACGAVDYRNGLNDAPEARPYITQPDIDKLQQQGYKIVSIGIEYVDDWRQVKA